MSQLFYHASDIQKPEDVIPHLAKGQQDWKKGRSAYELAHSWVDADGIPAPVRDVLETSEEFRDAEILEGLFEKETDLGTPGRSSQSDLLVLCRCAAGLGMIAVEGKVDETFGPLIKEWRDGAPGKERRLASLLKMLSIGTADAAELRYQLLHRTAAALLEARHYRAEAAMMLVHSFSPEAAGFDDFRRFAALLGAPVEKPDSVSPPLALSGTRLTLGWTADRTRAP